MSSKAKRMILFGSFLGLFCCYFLVFCGHFFVMQEKGMVPSLEPKAICYLKKNAYQSVDDVKRFDIVCFKQLFSDLDVFSVRRVVGLPNEIITIDRRQGMLVDYGKSKIDIKYTNLLHRVAPVDAYKNFQIITLKDDEVFVLSDNVTNHWDSRTFGAVKFGNIIGQVWPIGCRLTFERMKVGRK